jgi:hypothetical protein
MHDHYEEYAESDQELDNNSVRPELTKERANEHSRADRVCGGAVMSQPL